MKFIVCRTSGKDPPCANAVRGHAPWIDRRTFKSEAEHDKVSPKQKWRSMGTNHGFWYDKDGKKGICRTLDPQPIWTIELDLEGLLALANEEGSVVIGGSSYELPSIEIYDDYRE